MLFPLKHIRQDMMTPKFVLANDYSLGHYYYNFFFCLYHIIRVLKNKDAPIQFEQLFFLFFIYFLWGVLGGFENYVQMTMTILHVHEK